MPDDPLEETIVTIALYLALLIGGILFLLRGLFVTRMTWRTDAEPFGRRSRLFQIALHPEHFAKAERLREIRLLNGAGGLLLLGALIVVGVDIVSSIAGR
jgi:hypothetical protein